MALCLPPSPRRRVDVSAFSYSVTWWRNQAAGVKLLLRVVIRAFRLSRRLSGDSRWLSGDACPDRPLTLTLGSGSPRVRLRTLGRPGQTSKSWSESGIQSTVFYCAQKEPHVMNRPKKKKNNVFRWRLIFLGFSESLHASVVLMSRNAKSNQKKWHVRLSLLHYHKLDALGKDALGSYGVKIKKKKRSAYLQESSLSLEQCTINRA